MKGYIALAAILLGLAFTGIMLDYKPGQHATKLSYFSCLPLVGGLAVLVGAGLKNSNK
jgi:hypothetical protein